MDSTYLRYYVFKNRIQTDISSISAYIQDMIEVKNLSKKYKNTIAVDQVSFFVEKGNTLTLLGTSGSGKTTTLKMINRLIEPTKGEIWINGNNILAQKPEGLRKSIGYVIQNTGLFPHYTVEQNIGIVPKLLGWDKSECRKRTRVLLEMLGLSDDFLQRYPKELSGGQRQRVGIARALAANPPVILLDEPFGALDPITRSQIHQEFQNLEELTNATMVMVTHDVFEAVELGDEICLMDQGKIQQIGSPAELLFQPKNEFVHNFFQAQRFQLELKVLKLKNVINELREFDIQPKEKQKIISFKQDTDLLTVLEKSAKYTQGDVLIRVVNQVENNPVYAKREDILSVFYQKR